MENKEGSPIFWYILATILGVTVFKQFDFETLRFKNLGLGIIYLLTFGMCIFFIIKSEKEKE
jgi:hypothetical protein